MEKAILILPGLPPRHGYGYFSLFGAYNITAMFKNAVGPDVKLLQLGLTISGL